MASDHLADFFNFLTIEKGLSKNTTDAYRRDLERYFHYLSTKQLSVESVSPDDLTLYVAWLRGKDNTDLKLAEPSISRNVISVRGYYGYLAKEHGVKNPALNFKPPKISKRLPKALSVEQIFKMLNIAGDDLVSIRDRALVEVLYSTGARVSEIVGLNLLDLTTISSGTERVTTIKLRGKGGKERIVPIGSFAVAALENYLTRSRPTLVKNSTQKSFFLSQKGGRLTRQSAWNIVLKAAERAGIKEQVSPHSMRHSFATHLLDGGADIRVVQELLGHASVTTTQIYTLITIDKIRESYSTAHPRGK